MNESSCITLHVGGDQRTTFRSWVSHFTGFWGANSSCQYLQTEQSHRPDFISFSVVSDFIKDICILMNKLIKYFEIHEYAAIDFIINITEKYGDR